MILIRGDENNMENDNYKQNMKKLIQSFRNSYVSNYLFIKHYDTLTITKQEIYDIVVNEKYQDCLLYYKFPVHEMLEPYAPFLGWIRELYYSYFRDETPEEFVKNAKVYPLQQPVFVTYLKTGIACRTEDIMITEADYESKRMIDSIINIFSYIGERKPVFMFIESLHLINASGAKLLHAMISSKKLRNLRIMCMYNEVYRTLEYIVPEWKKLIDELERQNLQYEMGGVGTESTIDAQDIFIPQESNIVTYLQNANNMFFFQTYQDARHYLQIIYEKIEQDIIKVSKKTYARFLEVFAMIEIFCGEYTKALQLCEGVYEIGKKLEDDDILYQYNYICALGQCGMEQVEHKVGNYTQKCMDIARKKKDKLAEYKAERIQVLSNYNYWRDIYLDRYSYQTTKDFFKRTEEFGFLNTLAHLCVYCFENDADTIEEIIQGKRKQVYFQRGVEIATEIENWNALISAYSRNIVMLGTKANYSYINELYQKKLEIIRKEGSISRLVHSYNGMGYQAGIAEHYQEADEYFCKSLLECIKLKDGMELAITLYNSANNKMLAREYMEAAEDLEMVIQIMELLEIHSITVCETSKLYAMLAFCSFYMGEEYQCYLCLNRVEAYVCHLEHIEEEDKYRFWHGTLFLKHIIWAMIHTKENQLEEAKREFELAEYHQKQDKEGRYLNYPIYVMEIAKFYDICNMKEERIKVLEEGIEYCRQQGFHQKGNVLMGELQGKREIGKRISFSRSRVSKEEILAVVDNLAVEKKLEDSKKDIGFLTVWQDLLNKNHNTNEMLPQAISLLKNHFNLDGVLIVDIENNKDAAISFFEGPEIGENTAYVTRRIQQFTQLELEKIIEYFSKYKHAFLTNRIDKGFLEYKELLEIFDINHIITMFAAPLNNREGKLASVIIGYVEMRNNLIGNRYLLQEHDLVILKFVSQQLYVAIERLNYLELIRRMNSQLSDMAVTDLLTGLYNRQGFEKRIAEDQKKETEENIIIYLDLDNFKYYNDTFGHEIGDFVLVRFAQILEKVVDGIGYAVRYGGDEFVLVLNGKDVEFAKKLAKNIFYMLADGLGRDIERKIGYSVIIPMDKKLSCSIGIAACQGYSMEKITEALNKADKGLYYVKKTSKNNYVVWDELKNKE